MFKKIALTLAVTIMAATSAMASGQIDPNVLKEMIENKKPLILVDIQVPGEFEKHHIKGSIETNSYPTKTDAEKKQLDKVIPQIKSSKDTVVIICPQGKGGAARSVEYLKSHGVPEERIQILTGGISAWPFRDMIVQGR